MMVGQTLKAQDVGMLEEAEGYIFEKSGFLHQYDTDQK